MSKMVKCQGVVLESGEELAGRTRPFFGRLARNDATVRRWPAGGSPNRGRLSFCETIATLDVEPQRVRPSLARSPSSTTRETFHWSVPSEPCDLRSGVICSPNNFDYDASEIGAEKTDGTMRITALANFDYWQRAGRTELRLEKLRWYDRITDSAVRFVPEYRSRVLDTDMFTPTTIVRFTGHDNGAMYGAPEKQLDGRTHLRICSSAVPTRDLSASSGASSAASPWRTTLSARLRFAGLRHAIREILAASGNCLSLPRALESVIMAVVIKA